MSYTHAVVIVGKSTARAYTQFALLYTIGVLLDLQFHQRKANQALTTATLSFRQALCCKSGVEYEGYYSALDSGRIYR